MIRSPGANFHPNRSADVGGFGFNTAWSSRLRLRAPRSPRIIGQSTCTSLDGQLREVRRAWDFRFGLLPVTVLRDAANNARCCRWTAATAALVHQPTARFAILSHRLRGLPLMSRPPPVSNGSEQERFDGRPCRIDSGRTRVHDLFSP